MQKFKHQFVDIIPEILEPETVYISFKYNTASHLCPCDCGQEVVTPIDPNEWILIYNGASVSFKPSIGNTFDCRSHYWIIDNKIKWCDSPTLAPYSSQKKPRRKWWRFFLSLIGL